jgi:hypothetical protein
MSKFWSLAALVVGGIIIADLVINSQGTAQATSAFGQNLVTPTESALLGKTP